MQYLSKLKELAPSSTKYFNVYSTIIERAANRASTRKDALKLFCYVEAHHIFPKSLLPKDEHKNKDNIVYLSFKEHLICHRLLVKVFPHVPQFARAFFAMFSARNKTQTKALLTSRDAEILRLNSVNIAARNGRENGMWGKQHSKKTKAKIAEKRKGTHHSNETKNKMSLSRTGENNSFFGKRHSNETKQKIARSVSEKLAGHLHPAAKMFLFISPNGEETKVIGRFTDFCNTHNLSVAKMKRHVDLGIIQTPRQYYAKSNERTDNCIGWEIKSITHHSLEDTNY